MSGKALKNLARKLRKMLFGDADLQKSSGKPEIHGELDGGAGLPSKEVRQDRVERQEQREISPPSAGYASETPRREAHFVQVGFDFGTAFSKCVIRDVRTDMAHVFIPSDIADGDLPFLIPSTISFSEGTFGPDGSVPVNNHGSRLRFLKMALMNVSLGNYDDPSLRDFREHCPKDASRLRILVEAATAFYLARCMGDVCQYVRHRYADFGVHDDDRLFMNLALPVASADEAVVKDAFQRVVAAAWAKKDFVAEQPEAALEEVLGWFEKTGVINEKDCGWYLYPEVSANVQGYVRSRTSKPGIYLFADTGAGTVDQAVFVFSRQQGEKLTYLSARVLPLGSSFIEVRAAELMPRKFRWELEKLRKAKEEGKQTASLKAARGELRKKLARETLSVLAKAKADKLTVRKQIEKTELIFGGGGHCEDPYELGVKDAFRANIFSSELNPNAIGLPEPNDLEFPRGSNSAAWLRRLSVAYGLSFPRYELARFALPAGVPDATEIWRPKPVSVEYIGKEMV